MKSEKSKWGISVVIIMIVAIIILLMICVCVCISRPDSIQILACMEENYKRDFEIVEEFTYISHTDGEVEAQRELKCPAVILQDKENEEIRFLAYAYPLEGGDWIYRDNFSQKALVYCIKQEQLEINNEDKCEDLESSWNPCLVLENTDSTAQKLQNMVIRFNELYQSDDGCGAFEVEGSSLAYQIEGRNISDRWLDQTSPFCYDTPIEKYKAFLDELEEDIQNDSKTD